MMPLKPAKIPEKMANLMQNPQKSCGNQAFGLDFTYLRVAL